MGNEGFVWRFRRVVEEIQPQNPKGSIDAGHLMGGEEGKGGPGRYARTHARTHTGRAPGRRQDPVQAVSAPSVETRTLCRALDRGMETREQQWQWALKTGTNTTWQGFLLFLRRPSLI